MHAVAAHAHTDADLADTDAVRALVDKLAEIFRESEAFYEHEREADISIIADAVRADARRKDDSMP